MPLTAYTQYTQYALQNRANGLIGMTGTDPVRMRELADCYGYDLLEREVTVSEWAPCE